MRGFVKSVLYYGVGLSLATLSYLLAGAEYGHGPGLHHIVILLTFIGGFIWALSSIVKYFTGNRSRNLKEIILVNSGVSLVFVLFMHYEINKATGKSNTQYEERLTAGQTGDTTTIYYNNQIVYLKVKDSVLINFIDSSRVDWNKLELKTK